MQSAQLLLCDYEQLTLQLMHDEGCKKNAQGLHVAYRCTAGAWTIGYGHNLDANPLPYIFLDSAITEAQAISILADDIAVVRKSLDQHLPWAPVLLGMCAPRYCVLVNMAFNLGVAGLVSFRNTLGFVQRGEFAAAAVGMVQSKWATQVGGRARRLARQMEVGKWA